MVAPFTALSRGASCYSVSSPPAISAIWWGIHFWGLRRESPDSSTLPAWLGGVFPHLVPSNDKVNSESVVGIKPGDSGVVIGYCVMSLLTPGLQSGLWLIPTFILGSQVRCHY